MKWRQIVEAHEDTEAFRRWFGDSKVVANGTPRVVYHGTKSDFDIFRDQKTMAFGPGYYFTGYREEAGKFAVFQTGRAKVVRGANVMPVYLHLSGASERPASARRR